MGYWGIEVRHVLKQLVSNHQGPLCSIRTRKPEAFSLEFEPADQHLSVIYRSVRHYRLRPILATIY